MAVPVGPLVTLEDLERILLHLPPDTAVTARRGAITGDPGGCTVMIATVLNPRVAPVAVRTTRAAPTMQLALERALTDHIAALLSDESEVRSVG